MRNKEPDMKPFVALISSFFILFILHVQYVWAHTDEGTAMDEEIAAVYMEMADALNEDPPDFSLAADHFEKVKEEISRHMGEEPATTVMTHLKNEDKQAVQRAMQKIMVLNIVSHLNLAEDNYDDYELANDYLQRAYATYEVLSLDVRAEDKALDEALRIEFDSAAKTLGTPGVFGMGEKKSDRDTFLESKGMIITALRDQFNMEGVEVGHFHGEKDEIVEKQKPETPPASEASKWNWLPVASAVLIMLAILFVTMQKRR